ncbi:MAG: O-antigen ligase family protein [Mycobacterium sp.]
MTSQQLFSTRPEALTSSGCSDKSQRSLFWTGLWSVIAALVPVMRTSVNAGWQLPQRHIEYMILLALVVAALLGRVARPAGFPIWIAGAVVIPTAGFISGFSSSISASLTIAVELALICLLAPAVFRYEILRTKSFVPCVLSAFLVSQTLSAATGVLQLTGADVFGRGAVFGRSTGFAGHPNVLGLMAVIALLVSLTMMRNAPRPAQAALWGAFAVNAVSLVGTGSLSSMLAGAVGLMVYAIGRRRLVAAFFAALAAGTSIFIVGGAWAVSVVEYRMAVVTGADDVGGAASVDVRLRTYQWALEYLSDDPLFGVGMDDASSGTFDGVTAVHTYLLHAWYQGGLLLFLWFLAVTALLLTTILRAMAGSRSVEAAAVLAAFLTFASMSAFFAQDQYWLPLLFAIATLPAVGMSKHARTPTVDTGLIR